ncbi:MAG: type II toxin-antitoxin system VapC family toxin [Pseudonocardiaceae bacterium]
MSYVVLDTDVASMSFRGQVPPRLLAQLADAPTCITFVILAELTQWAVQRGWGASNRARLEHWLSGVVVLPGNETVAHVWGEIAAYARLRGRPRPQNDTWIAATCLAHELPLATLNVKDFSDFADHEGLPIITA